MKCREVKNKISGFIDKDLPENLFKEVEIHLETCQKCNKMYIETLKITNVLKSSQPVKAPTSFLAEINKKIDLEQEQSLSQQILKRINLFLSLRHIIEASGAVAVAVIIFIIINPVADLQQNLTDIKSEPDLVYARRDISRETKKRSLEIKNIAKKDRLKKKAPSLKLPYGKGAGHDKSISLRDAPSPPFEIKKDSRIEDPIIIHLTPDETGKTGLADRSKKEIKPEALADEEKSVEESEKTPRRVRRKYFRTREMSPAVKQNKSTPITEIEESNFQNITRQIKSAAAKNGIKILRVSDGLIVLEVPASKKINFQRFLKSLAQVGHITIENKSDIGEKKKQIEIKIK